MALIKCKKCANKISSKSVRCVHCGKKIKSTNWLLILIFGTLFLLLIVGLTFCFLFKSISDHQSTWTNRVEYYADKNLTNYLCTVESTITTAGKKIHYASWVTDGNCDYSDIYMNGKFDVDNNKIEAEFNIYDDEYDVDFIKGNNYICYENCNKKENVFYKLIDNRKVIKKYMETMNSTHDKANFSSFVNISYDDFKKMITNNGTGVVFIGSESCEYCLKYASILNELQIEKNISINHLNIDTLSEIEKIELMNSINNIDNSIPVVAYFNDGLKGTTVGLQTKEVTVNLLIQYGFLNNSL